MYLITLENSSGELYFSQTTITLVNLSKGLTY